MTYWLCITNEENWNVVKEKNIWGVPERHKNTIIPEEDFEVIRKMS